ncbi:MAG: phosphatase [Succinivibrio sp.]
MRFPVDLHTHTLASAHAYSTIVEYVSQAAKCGIRMFATTDHGPAVGDGPHPWHFGNLKVVPRICDNIAVLRGIEANIMEDGSIDLEERYAKRLDIILAGFHPNITPSTEDEHTKIYLELIRNGYADVITHPGNPNYPCDYEQVLLAAKEYNVAVEINASSDVHTRFGSHENCLRIAKLAAKIGNTISLGSDAHISYYLGQFEGLSELISQSGIKESQIINTSALKVLDFLESRGRSPIPQIREFFQRVK